MSFLINLLTSSILGNSPRVSMSEYMFFTDGSKMRLAFGDKISESTEIPSKYYVDYIHLYQMPGVGEMIINQERS